ncbi:MAG: glutamyl-tRNA reductase [Chloroflexi bacterium]|nr:glutamyl-tRNA reductase [Chloroflexota bacterium]
MVVLLVGISHHSAPVAVRERFALTGDDGDRMLRSLLEYVSHGAVLATCNRTEIYTTVRNAEVGTRHLQRFLSAWSAMPPDQVATFLYSASHDKAARHLFRVAAGLDSLILGEEQILGQVRDAMHLAHAHNSLDPALYALFRHALRSGKAAHTYTAISRKAVSVSAAAVALARDHFGSLAGCQVLVISAGEAGKLTARSLADSGAGAITVTSRTYERAAVLAASLGGRAVPFEDLPQALAQADVVVSSTAAPGYVLTADEVRAALAQRPERPLFLIDIAVPRDIDPAVGALSGVVLRNIDDLQRLAEANLNGRRQEVAKVEALVDREVRSFLEWWNRRDVIPTVAALRNQADAIRRAELERTLAHLDLSEAERTRIDAMTNAIVKKLLHHPLTYLKANPDEQGYIEAVRTLFALDAPEDHGRRTPARSRSRRGDIPGDHPAPVHPEPVEP